MFTCMLLKSTQLNNSISFEKRSCFSHCYPHRACKVFQAFIFSYFVQIFICIFTTSRRIVQVAISVLLLLFCCVILDFNFSPRFRFSTFLLVFFNIIKFSTTSASTASISQSPKLDVQQIAEFDNEQRKNELQPKLSSWLFLFCRCFDLL